MTLEHPSIILITGILAAGKTSVAQKLAERLPKSVHLRGDIFRRMIVSGRAEMQPPLSDEAMDQLRLRYRLAANVANTTCDAGFTVVYQDVVLGPLLDEAIALLRGKNQLYVVMLCPSPDVVASREAGRAKAAYRGWTPEEMDRDMRATTPKVGLWLDTSQQSISETVDKIVERSIEARIS